MRVACLCTDRGVPYGGTKGASVHLAEIAAALAAEGADVLVLVATTTPRVAAPPEGVLVETLPVPAEREPWLEARLECFQPALLYERLALHSAAGSRAAKRLGIRHVVEVNAPLPEEALRYRRLEDPAAAERLERAVLSGADLVLPVSPALVEYVRLRGARRVEVLQNAVAIERFAAPWSANGGPPVAVFAGSLRPWHGIETIAGAWRLLGTDAPPLVVVGDGPAREHLQGTGARTCGAVDHACVPALLGCADIGLAPYGAKAPRYFSPLKLFEYLAAGLATIVADIPATAAIVDADSAVVIPRGDPAALAGAVRALAADPERRRRLGENGRALVTAQHTWRHRARRILEEARA
jgi:glycosyltransferase involved in cell wall biosynthesis